MNQRAYLVFEGGGAKGLVHVGALSAIEGRSVEIRGVAGTSAGAIIAGLVAAGYTSAELFNEETGTNILRSLDYSSATEVFGQRGWSRIRRAKRAVRIATSPWSFVALPLIWFFNYGLVHLSSTIGPAWIAVIVTAEVLIPIAIAAYLVGLFRRGLCNLVSFIEAYNRALARKLGKSESGPSITFADIEAATSRDLKVVATCVNTREIAVFGTAETPNVSVAEAVAASACLPGIFRPVQVANSVPAHAFHYDGGLVSNLPVWVFDEARVLDQDALTIAIEIGEPGRPELSLRGLFSWLSATIRAAIFGGSILNKRAAEQLYSFTIKTRINVLDFDRSLEDAKEDVRNSRKAAEALIGFEIFEIRKLFTDACEEIRKEILNQLQLGMEGTTTPPPIVRVAVASPLTAAGHSLRLDYSSGLANCSDEAMFLPMRDSLAGGAWRERDVLFDAYPFTPEYNLGSSGSRRRRSLAWREAKWRIAIPIYPKSARRDGPPTNVLCIDGNSDAAYAKGVLTDEFVGAAAEKIAEVCDVILASKRTLETMQ